MKMIEIVPITKSNGEKVGVRRPYYDDMLKSIFQITNGVAFNNFRFFNAEEASTLRNYDINNGNPFQSGEGRVFGVSMELVNDNGADLPLSDTSLRAEVQKVRIFGQLEIKAGGDTIKRVGFDDMMPELPVVVESAADTPQGVASPLHYSHDRTETPNKIVTIGDPAPLIQQGVRLEFIPSFLNNYTFGADLNGALLVMRLHCRQYYGGNINPVKA